MPEDTNADHWHPARLIPTAGIRGQEEQERRATSSLLAVMGAVPDYGRAILDKLGAPRGRISTFAEVQLKDPDGKLSIPDGAVVVERGKTHWRCLVEVKTSGAPLKVEQVARYLDMARTHNFDAVLTISNQITATPKDSAVAVDKRKAGNRLFHLSWWLVLTEAIVQHRFRGIEDPDQAWILGELIAYLDHEKSGASGFQDMGDKWVTVRNAAANGTLRPSDREARDVAERWDQFIDYLALGLSQDLGRDVRPMRPRKQTGEARLDATVKGMAEGGTLQGSIRVPDAVGPITVVADLRTRKLTTSVAVEAPKDRRRPQTHINWIVRQLKNAPSDLRIDVSFASARETTSALLEEAREYPQKLFSTTDPKREPRSFNLALTQAMGTKRGRGEKSFVLETRQQAVDFYRRIVQDLRAWQASAPKLPNEPEKAPETPTAEPPPFSAEDEREAGEAVDPLPY
jgi:hypothetical protein